MRGQIKDRADAAGDEVDSVAHAASELLTVLATATESHHDGGPLTDTARRYDRASRTPHRVLPNPDGDLARDLRLVARRLAAAGAVSGRGSEKLALTALVVALGSLLAEIAAWQHTRQRPHHAVPARDSATALSRYSRDHRESATTTVADRLPPARPAVAPVPGARATPPPSARPSRPTPLPTDARPRHRR